MFQSQRLDIEFEISLGVLHKLLPMTFRNLGVLQLLNQRDRILELFDHKGQFLVSGMSIILMGQFLPKFIELVRTHFQDIGV